MVKKNARSIKLDNAIEDELKIMLTLGLDKAPITASTLYKRLIAKEVIKGAISTLTPRSKLIDEYSFQQKEAHGIAKDEPKYGTVEYYKARNQKLIADNSELKRRLSANVAALDAIIKNVESKSAVKVEDLVGEILNPMEELPF
jgi:hypothetical protein